MIEVLDPGGDVFEKMLPGFCQTDAAVTSLEQENAKILFELFDPRADGGLTHSQGGGAVLGTLRTCRPLGGMTAFRGKADFGLAFADVAA
jgi:hypothetical protein